MFIEHILDRLHSNFPCIHYITHVWNCAYHHIVWKLYIEIELELIDYYLLMSGETLFD